MDSVSNGTIFLTQSSLNTITNLVGIVIDLPSATWLDLIVHKHEVSVPERQNCQGIMVEEEWQFSVFDDTKKICYFGNLDAEETLDLDDEVVRDLSVNTNQLKEFQSETFVVRHSNIYNPYPFVRYSDAKSIEHCAMVCYFKDEEKCDFYFIHGSYCYLGNFNQASAIGSSGDWVNTYIYKRKTIAVDLNDAVTCIILIFDIIDKVSDMLDKLFPKTLLIEHNRWSRRIRERFSAVSELECGAHAALAHGPIDYFIYLDGECYLGNIPDGSSALGDGTKHSIRLRTGNAWSDISSRFNEHFTLSSYIWNKYIFETHALQTSDHSIECGLQCELSPSQCDFFCSSSGKCYLGRYSHWASGTVSDNSLPLTYHRSGWIGKQFVRKLAFTYIF